MRRRRSGFSLVDLLIVLIVLGVVCAVVSPLLVANKGMSPQTRCSSSMKQLGLGLVQYAMDHDEAYPPAMTGGPHGSIVAATEVWANSIAPYLKQPLADLTCPDVRGGRGAAAEYARLHPGQTTGYAYNAYYADAVRTGSKKPPVLGSAALTIILAEARPGILAQYAPDVSRGAPLPALVNLGYLEVTAASAEGATRHSKGANYAFADGHTRWYRPEHIQAGPKTDGKSPGFGL